MWSQFSILCLWKQHGSSRRSWCDGIWCFTALFHVGYNSEHINFTIDNCIFRGNNASGYSFCFVRKCFIIVTGGAMNIFAEQGTGSITNCLFINNRYGSTDQDRASDIYARGYTCRYIISFFIFMFLKTFFLGTDLKFFNASNVVDTLSSSNSPRFIYTSVENDYSNLFMEYTPVSRVQTYLDFSKEGLIKSINFFYYL
jgi:hypothetical protein